MPPIYVNTKDALTGSIMGGQPVRAMMTNSGADLWILGLVFAATSTIRLAKGGISTAIVMVNSSMPREGLPKGHRTTWQVGGLAIERSWLRVTILQAVLRSKSEPDYVTLCPSSLVYRKPAAQPSLTSSSSSPFSGSAFYCGE